MPLIIGELHARIEVERPRTPEPTAPGCERDAEERRRAAALAAERFERERRIEQRDPDLLGGQ